MRLLQKHEHDDYCVKAHRSIDLHSDYDYLWSGTSFIKAVYMYLYLNYKFPKHTIRFTHGRYYD